MKKNSYYIDFFYLGKYNSTSKNDILKTEKLHNISKYYVRRKNGKYSRDKKS